MVDNANFSKDLLSRFNPETDKLIFMCRSGKRSCFFCEALIGEGWDAKEVYNMLGAFEGDKIKKRKPAFSTASENSAAGKTKGFPGRTIKTLERMPIM